MREKFFSHSLSYPISIYSGNHPLFIQSFSAEFDRKSDFRKSELDKGTYLCSNPRGYHIIVGSIALQDEMHRAYIIFGMPPITSCRKIPQVEPILQSHGNAAGTSRYLASYKGLSTERGFVVKENAIASMYSICLAVVHRNPISIEFGNGIGASGVEWGCLSLRHLLYKPKEFAGRGLVETHFIFHTEEMYCL